VVYIIQKIFYRSSLQVILEILWFVDEETFYNSALIRLNVSVAIISSSLVGTTITFTFESVVDIFISSLLILLFFSSNLIHR
jgi:hypothetical protein